MDSSIYSIYIYNGTTILFNFNVNFPLFLPSLSLFHLSFNIYLKSAIRIKQKAHHLHTYKHTPRKYAKIMSLYWKIILLSLSLLFAILMRKIKRRRGRIFHNNNLQNHILLLFILFLIIIIIIIIAQLN